MGHEPRGFQGHAKGAGKLVATDPFLAGAKQIHGLQPKSHRDVAVFENGPDRGMKLLPAGVALQRADFGALQNRLQTSVSNINNSVENMSAANSRIRDVDVAEETSEMTRNHILLQAGTSVLAQANQSANVALNLLNKTFGG